MLRRKKERETQENPQDAQLISFLEHVFSLSSLKLKPISRVGESHNLIYIQQVSWSELLNTIEGCWGPSIFFF